MKTPYDTAIRVQRREIDTMGAAINIQVNILNQIETLQKEGRSTVAREASVAANDIGVSAHAYIARLRAEQARLAREGALHDARLAQLRSRAAAAYGACRTVEIAAEGYRDDADRRLANAEQAEMDDSVAIAFLEARKALRRSRGR